MDPIQVTPALLGGMPLPHHDDDDTKGERGQLLVIGGGRETPGAALLAGLAGLRVGAGKLQVATTNGVSTALAIAMPEALVVGLPETDGGSLSPAGAGRAAELASRADAVLVGPGVLDDEGMDAILGAVLDAAQGVVVIDAGAIPAAGRRKHLGARVVATPNADECAQLGPDPAAVAADLGATICRRAASTLTIAPDGRCWLDDAGALGLATSGSGDVASGAIAGLAARGAAPEVAAVWGAHVHGVAGEWLAARIGRVGFLAREIVDELPLVLDYLTRKPDPDDWA